MDSLQAVILLYGGNLLFLYAHIERMTTFTSQLFPASQRLYSYSYSYSYYQNLDCSQLYLGSAVAFWSVSPSLHWLPSISLQSQI